MAAPASAIVQLAPEGMKVVRISFVSCMDRENTISVEQLPCPAEGYRMPLATLVNLWDIYTAT